ncbi:hypothetical protein R3P38DRAFT_2825751 [Favolaschia claudopus]|uniref:Uncharacterized protein n=1 Tax=Favolaschia claudopus TaxID=2862362 RepID=A0AAW0EJG3_9AGAR
MFFIYISFLVLGWLAYLGAADLAKTGYHEFTTTAPTLLSYASALAREFAIITPILLVLAFEIAVAGYVLWHVLINNGYIDSDKSRFSNIEGPFPQASASECSIVVLAGASLFLRAVASPLDEDIDSTQFVPGAYSNDLESTDATISTTASLVLMSVSRTDLQQGMLSRHLPSLLGCIRATYHLWIISTRQSLRLLLDAFETVPKNHRLLGYPFPVPEHAPDALQYQNNTVEESSMEDEHKNPTLLEELSFANPSIPRAITWIEHTSDDAFAALDINAAYIDAGEDNTLAEDAEPAAHPPTSAVDEISTTPAVFDARVECEPPNVDYSLARSATTPAPPTITSQLDLASQTQVSVDDTFDSASTGIALTSPEDSESNDLSATRFALGMSAASSTPVTKLTGPPAPSKSTLKGSASAYMYKFRSATARIAPPFKKSFSFSVRKASPTSIPPSTSDAPTLVDTTTKKLTKKSLFRRPPLPFRSRGQSIHAPVVPAPPL